MIMNNECSYGPELPVSTFRVRKDIFSYSMFKGFVSLKRFV